LNEQEEHMLIQGIASGVVECLDGSIVAGYVEE
jgi:hypothetical protein